MFKSLSLSLYIHIYVYISIYVYTQYFLCICFVLFLQGDLRVPQAFLVGQLAPEVGLYLVYISVSLLYSFYLFVSVISCMLCIVCYVSLEVRLCLHAAEPQHGRLLLVLLDVVEAVVAFAVLDDVSNTC